MGSVNLPANGNRARGGRSATHDGVQEGRWSKIVEGKATSRSVTDTPYDLEGAGPRINASLLPWTEQLSGARVSS